MGKFRIYLRRLHEMDPLGYPAYGEFREMIAYVSEHKNHIAPFPRYYVYPYIWMKLRISAKRIRLFPAEEVNL